MNAQKKKELIKKEVLVVIKNVSIVVKVVTSPIIVQIQKTRITEEEVVSEEEDKIEEIKEEVEEISEINLEVEVDLKNMEINRVVKKNNGAILKMNNSNKMDGKKLIKWMKNKILEDGHSKIERINNYLVNNDFYVKNPYLFY